MKNKYIELPLSVSIKRNNINHLDIKGHLGSIRTKILESVNIQLYKNLKKDNNKTLLSFSSNSTSKTRSRYFLTKVVNAVYGLTHGYLVQLYLVGAKFRAAINNQDILILNLSFNRYISVNLPPKTMISLLKSNQKTWIQIFGVDKESINSLARDLYKLRKVDYYKERGLRFKNRSIILKKRINK